ncbi:MAG: GrpB family protein [Synechococcales cyanobacterium]
MQPNCENDTAQASATTEAYLTAVTIGPCEPLNSTIYLAPHDPTWESQFLVLAHRVRQALAEKVLLLEHVGSTSVPGLSAKPVIDLVLAVADSADESSYVPALEQYGFVLRIREPDWFQHRLLRYPDMACNLHVFTVGCEEIHRMLVFRDWLRTHEDERRRYEQVKLELASRTWKYVQNYADAKSAVVREILRRAGKDRAMSLARSD